MKTELKIPESKPELKFPLLAQSKNTKAIVLFRGPESGTVMHPGSGCLAVGYHSTTFSDVMDNMQWTILPPDTQLVITQE